ncbi:hypothetical protein D8B26_007162 [Coccidioides posadasii str. Silveira]|uniref:uncharacterized protein n=1 Tax=Coccidioides posadasii (strain RMSCC 757 / Silveira) TaxID=443226 RepID=UPI001BF1111F|nr:hypothetical protein D8B26_007162 [Coccidioides posadasii str. Silveira]
MDNLLLHSTSWNNVFLGSGASQVSSLSKVRLHRRQRNRRYRSALLGEGTVDDAFDPRTRAHGVPRAYKVKFTDATASHDRSLDDLTIVFGRLGDAAGGILLGNHHIGPQDVTLSTSTKTYTFSTTLDLDVDGERQKVPVAGYVNFESRVPAGHLEINCRLFKATFIPSPLYFQVKISHNAGAYRSSADNSLKWDTGSGEWANATWESSLVFGYRVVIQDDPIMPRKFIENFFHDKASDPETLLELKNGIGYSCIMQGDIMQTTTSSVPPPPGERANQPVRSAFPDLFVVKFEDFGGTFNGAYEWKDQGNDTSHVYAVSGKVDLPVSSALPLLASGKNKKQASSLFDFLENREKSINTADPPLEVTTLLNNDPMKWVPEIGEYRDEAASRAMEDFYEIIKYYLDEDLRKTFISATPIILPDKVKAIADDHPDNYIFYKKLQVPYLTTVLGTSTLDEGAVCNAKRAEKLLGSLPTDDEVYKRHSSALYRMHYLEMFPSTRDFLDDQQNKNYSSDIDNIANVLKNRLAETSEDLKPTNPDYEADLAKAQADIENLAAWAKRKKLYWAYMVLYWVEFSAIPQWYSQYINGTLSESVGRQIKKLNSIFGTVENDQVNTAEGGRSFMEAFNDAVRLFQMSSIIPQLVDLDRNSSDYDSLVKAALYEFWEKNKNSSTPEIAQQAELAKQLFENDQLRRNFQLSLRSAQALAGGFASWSVLMGKWENIVTETGWYKALGSRARGLFTTIQTLSAAAMIAMPFFTGGWSEMSDAQRASWVMSIVGLVGGLGFRIARGIVTIAGLFEHISTLKDVMKVFFKFDKFMSEIPDAANKISASFAKYFTRTAKQVLGIEMLEEIIPVKQFSQIAKIFGRNISEILASVAGIVLAVTGLVFASMDLAKAQEPLETAYHLMLILSSAIQLLGIVAGWIAGASWLPSMVTPILSYVGTLAGPLSVVLAVVGVIIYVIYLFKKKPPNPVEQFINNHVKPAKLYMEHTAIDYFDVITSDKGELSRVGLSIQGAGPDASPSEQVYLQLTGTEPPATLAYGQTLGFTTDDVWSLQTNGNGESQISTQKYFTDDEGNKYRTVWFIGRAENDQTKLTLIQLPSRKDEPDKYAKLVKQTYWNIEVAAAPEKDPESQQLSTALCRIKHESNLLALESDPNSKDPRGLKVVKESDISKGRYIYLWMFNMEPLGPVDFSYMHNPWTLIEGNADEVNGVMWDETQSTSAGLQWSISPALNANVFELIKTSGSDEGSISMKSGVRAPVMPKTTYTVTCTASLPGNKTAQKKATVDISVEAE